MKLFGDKRVSQADVAAVSAEIAERDSKDQREAKAEWMARVKAVKAAAKLPDKPFRIRRHLRSSPWGGADATHDGWVCEAASTYVETCPRRTDGEPARLHASFGSFGYATFWGDPDYRAEDYRGAMEPTTSVVWRTIGPTRPAASGGLSGSPNITYEPAPFSTFEEAERWLQTFLTPHADEVYFATPPTPTE